MEECTLRFMAKKGDIFSNSWPVAGSMLPSRKRREGKMLELEIMTEKGPHPIPAMAKESRVLVVDDNKTIREALSGMLVSLGYKVTLASNGFEGGILFLTRPYDLAIINLDVPEMNVWELSRIFKDHSPKTPVIMITGFLEGKHWKKSDTNSVDAIIPKPFKLKDIEGTVRRLLYSGKISKYRTTIYDI
jgi:CheY-like chemotaxis protein